MLYENPLSLEQEFGIVEVKYGSTQEQKFSRKDAKKKRRKKIISLIKFLTKVNA